MNSQKVKGFYTIDIIKGIATCKICNKAMSSKHDGNLKKHLQNGHCEVSIHKIHI